MADDDELAKDPALDALMKAHRCAHGLAGDIAGLIKMIDAGEVVLKPDQAVVVLRADLAEYEMAKALALSFFPGEAHRWSMH